MRTHQLALDMPAPAIVGWLLGRKLNISQLHDHLQSFLRKVSLQHHARLLVEFQGFECFGLRLEYVSTPPIFQPI